ncbi:MAG: acetyl-CoA hydrolase [Gammaproteobacteria bacterium]|nr:acetyl-CoA hydrolase [Gammaproteobacteria bacterium]
MNFDDPESVIDQIIDKVGKDLVVGTPLAVGKPNHLLNALYNRAKNSPDLNLKIFTALTLDKPKGNSLLEKRFFGPMAERIFGDYPDLDYEQDRQAGALPSNVEILEFYFPAGRYLHNDYAQQNYICSNYTHVARDMMDAGVNVLLQMVSKGTFEGKECYSLSSNPDVSLDLIRLMQKRYSDDGTLFAFAAQVNQNLPFMYGDALVSRHTFDFVLVNADLEYRIFCPPKMAVSDSDFLIGLYVSTLIRDGGELQVGIGSIGDALVYALLLRQRQNEVYQELLKDFAIIENFGAVIDRIGGTAPFVTGLFAASEMVVDGFMELYEAGIIKRKVYDDLVIQRLINEGKIDEKITPETLDLILMRKGIHKAITQADFDYLRKFGIFRRNLAFDDSKILTPEGQTLTNDLDDLDNREAIYDYCLGDKLTNADVIQGGFFLGCQKFYDWLRNLSDEDRGLINMKSVQDINQLYGHEEIDRLHRKDARFVNTCMMMTLNGSAVSDGLDNNRVISGVGGQYNFVAMAHALPDGRSILNLRSTRITGKGETSSIVWNYGQMTIPRHLRDIVVTEFGIADLRGKTDQEIIHQLLTITDSRFQQGLVDAAKENGKIRSNYSVSAAFRQNGVAEISKKLAKYKDRGLFNAFPFGTDLTEEEIFVGRALKILKKKKQNPLTMIATLLKAFFIPVDQKPYRKYLQRMQLDKASSFEEKLYQKLLAYEFSRFERSN